MIPLCFLLADNQALLAGVSGVFVLGVYLLGYFHGFNQSKKKEVTITMALQLDATQPIKISANVRDAEGNKLDVSAADLVLSVENATEGFGELNDANDTFNPGSAGATGTIVGSLTLNGVEYKASVDVELVAGAASEFSLDFAPVNP